MSKPSSSRLTPSGRKRLRRSRPDLLDLLDALNERCRNIGALAGLLEACGQPPDAPPLAVALVSQAGTLIERETQVMKALLAAAAKGNRERG